MKQKPKELDCYNQKLNLVKEISKVMAYDYSEYDAMSNNPTPEDEALKLLDSYLTQQRTKLLEDLAQIKGVGIKTIIHLLNKKDE